MQNTAIIFRVGRMAASSEDSFPWLLFRPDFAFEKPDAMISARFASALPGPVAKS